MANKEHLTILKKQAEAWNKWREEHPNIQPDLSGLNFRSIDQLMMRNEGPILVGVNLSLDGGFFDYADFREARLSGAYLGVTTFIRADFSGADLDDADFYGSAFTNAILRGADLSGANIRDTSLNYADLREVDLSGAVLRDADLKGTDLSGAEVDNTIFGNIDLSLVKGLDRINHTGPATIGMDTIYRSSGRIPEVFLRGVGVPETFINYARSLTWKAIDCYTCFISYSSKDQAFAERLHADLQSKGVRCWFAPEDLRIGDKIRPRIEESIRLYNKLLLVLSEHSIASNWVAYEVERALNKEPQGVPNVLFPIRLDDAVMNSKASWADDIKSTRHICDFTHWKEQGEYQTAFNRLLRDLKAQ